jgi:hypothetical protein
MSPVFLRFTASYYPFKPFFFQILAPHTKLDKYVLVGILHAMLEEHHIRSFHAKVRTPNIPSVKCTQRILVPPV